VSDFLVFSITLWGCITFRDKFFWTWIFTHILFLMLYKFSIFYFIFKNFISKVTVLHYYGRFEPKLVSVSCNDPSVLTFNLKPTSLYFYSLQYNLLHSLRILVWNTLVLVLILFLTQNGGSHLVTLLQLYLIQIISYPNLDLLLRVI